MDDKKETLKDLNESLIEINRKTKKKLYIYTIVFGVIALLVPLIWLYVTIDTKQTGNSIEIEGHTLTRIKKLENSVDRLNKNLVEYNKILKEPRTNIDLNKLGSRVTRFR